MAAGHLQKILDKHRMTREAEASSQSRTTLAVQKKVAAGHLQNLLDKPRMTREAGASSQSRKQFSR